MLTFDMTGIVALTRRRLDDERGWFSETFRQSVADEALGAVQFVQDNVSLSRSAGSIRGLHFQSPPCAQAKLVSVLQGAVLDVAVDLRQSSETFGRHVAVELSAENGVALFVPIGFAHGFCTLEPDTLVSYKVSAYYDPETERGLAWDDPALDIHWPAPPGQAVLSEKDLNLPRLADLPSFFA